MGALLQFAERAPLGIVRSPRIVATQLGFCVPHLALRLTQCGRAFAGHELPQLVHQAAQLVAQPRLGFRVALVAAVGELTALTALVARLLLAALLPAFLVAVLLLALLGAAEAAVHELALLLEHGIELVHHLHAALAFGVFPAGSRRLHVLQHIAELGEQFLGRLA